MKKRFTAGVLLAIFTFLFLETEYLFVNIMSAFSSSQQAVSAQGIVLGVSVIGFLLYALFHRIKSAFVKRVVTVMFPLIMADRKSTRLNSSHSTSSRMPSSA